MEARQSTSNPWWVRGWVLALSLLVLAPLLRPGYVLQIDMVFAPHQSLLPTSLGLGAGLPRAVPQDAVVSLISGPLPGWILQRVVLTAVFVAGGLGIARLAREFTRGDAILVQGVAVSLYLWNPYVAERLLIGHWALLLGYAMLPWIAVLVIRFRESGQGEQLPLAASVVLVAAVGSLVPTAGILVALVAVPMLLVPGAAALGRRIALSAVVVGLNAPWLVPTLLHPSGATSDPLAATVFDLRADGAGSALATALSGGGIWNLDAVPYTRTTAVALLAAAALLLLFAAGAGELWRGTKRGDVSIRALAVVAVGLLVLVLLLTWAPGVAAELQAGVPGMGLLRDGQKWLAPWVLVASLGAALGASRLASRFSDSGARRAALVALALLPVALLPDLAWGGLGRMNPVQYPSEWHRAREVVAAQGSEGAFAEPGRPRMLSLPWSTFRRYPWNAERTVLDPAPRFFTVPVVADDSLLVSRGGDVLRVAGDDPISARVSELLDSPGTTPEQFQDALRSAGVSTILLQTGQPTPVREELLVGLPVLVDGEGLRLFAVPGAAEVPAPQRLWLAAGVDLLVLAVVISAAMGVLVTRMRWSRLPTAK